MNPTAKAISILSLLYLTFFLYAFSTFSFLNHQVFSTYIFTYQSLLEPLVYLSTLGLSYWYLVTRVISRKKLKTVYHESKLYVPAIILLMLLAFGFGIHSTAQLIEDAISNHNNSIFFLTYFLDEYPGHIFVTLPATILSYFLTLFEINRYSQKLTKLDKGVIVFNSILHGIFLVVGGYEGGSQYLILWPFYFLILILITKNLA